MLGRKGALSSVAHILSGCCGALCVTPGELWWVELCLAAKGCGANVQCVRLLFLLLLPYFI